MLIKPPVILDPYEHTMEAALFGYLDLKVHEYIRKSDHEYIRKSEYDCIIVSGNAQRDHGISYLEKGNKQFNSYRPTASIHGRTLHIYCFPGFDYIVHYATLIKTYLAIHNRKYDHVFYQLPTKKYCIQALLKTNFNTVPHGDIAILGSGLELLSSEITTPWQGEGPFLWKEKKTGSSSTINGKVIHWRNIFEHSYTIPEIITGCHITCPSVLDETKDWLLQHKEYQFVDPEIGHMAYAAQCSNIQFSYLHIISDNLMTKYSENLSNERENSIIGKRLYLFGIIQKILNDIF